MKAIVAVKGKKGKLPGKRVERNINKTIVKIKMGAPMLEVKKGRKSKSKARHQNDDLLLSPDNLKTFQKSFLPTAITCIGAEKRNWDISTSTTFCSHLEVDYRFFFPNIVKACPDILPFNVHGPEFIVLARVRSWRTKLGQVAVGMVRNFFNNAMLPISIPSLAGDTTTNNDGCKNTLGSTESIARREPAGSNGVETIPVTVANEEKYDPCTCDLISVGGRQKWVNHMIESPNYPFVYADPDPKKPTSAFRNNIIMQTYTVHHQLVLQCPFEVNAQAGALALVSTAVLRALECWETGEEKAAQEFGAAHYRALTERFYETTRHLSDAAWEAIEDLAFNTLPKRVRTAIAAGNHPDTSEPEGGAEEPLAIILD